MHTFPQEPNDSQYLDKIIHSESIQNSTMLHKNLTPEEPPMKRTRLCPECHALQGVGTALCCFTSTMLNQWAIAWEIGMLAVPCTLDSDDTK